VNKVIIMGYLGRDPEVSSTQSGMTKTVLAISTSRKSKTGEEVTSWHRVTAWGKTAEVIAHYFSKGMMIYIEGELVYGQYEKDGQKHYTTDIYVREFAFCGASNAKTGQPQNNQMSGGQQQQRQQYQQPQNNNGYNGQPLNQEQRDDIPF
jgi:single-strand DNA-binding protein